ncbi:MAG: hypothetical protein F6K17_34500, partial [Okeania sp. SIO3C4]|nr:hypothetical protein [Okeania sp. SIO3C4]
MTRKNVGGSYQRKLLTSDDFYVSTIYPTEVRVKGQWIRVQNQRMDGAIAITETDGKIQA